jgi:hypothetical protein
MCDENDGPLRKFASIELQCVEKRAAMITDVVLIGRPTKEVRDARVVSKSENARALAVGGEQVHGPKDHVSRRVEVAIATRGFRSPTKDLLKIALWLRRRPGWELPGLLRVSLKAVDQDNAIVFRTRSATE